MSELGRVGSVVNQGSLALSLDYLRVSPMNYPADIELENGWKIEFREKEDNMVFWNIFVRRNYRLRGDEETILDLGGNIGLFALYAAAKAPKARIHSFEPSRTTGQRYEKLMERNGLTQRVSLHPWALSDHEGSIRMAGEDVASAQKRVMVEGDAAGAGEEVRCRPLGTVVDELGLDRIDLMKVDIEGSEFQVLHNTPIEVLRKVRRMELETHRNRTAGEYRREELLKYLGKAGLEVADLEVDEEDFAQVYLVNRDQG